MHTAVTTVTPETRVSAAYQVMTMRATRMRHLPVVTHEGILVGILTDRDLRRAAASDTPPMAEHEWLSLLDKLHVRDIMTPEVVTVHGTTPVAEAGQMFLQHKFWCLPVVRDNHTLAGMLTVTDLLRAYTAQSEAERWVSVGSMMHTPVITAMPTMSLAEVQRMMRNSNIRHVPVVSGKRLVGIITDRDLREASPSPATTLTRGEIAYQMATTPIKTCMTQDVLWISPDMSMVDAARVLVQRTIDCLPVVDHGALVDIVTAVDCVHAFLHPGRVAERGETSQRTRIPQEP
jgi:acetoin utilization protein AcuB